MKLRLTGTLVLVLGIAAVASASAYAANGHGNGKNDPPAAPATAAASADHGNAANAPGQLKKDEAPAAATAADVSVQVGVKPANDTAHDTHAPASSDQTKLYGNGKTAGQIAIAKGAAPSTSLHGPGNSQPHKASPCSGGHEVDVHALKGKRRGSCGNPLPPPHSIPDPAKDHGHGSPSGAGVAAASSGSAAGPSDPGKRGKRGSHVGDSAGVLASAGAVEGASLPFTGIDLWSGVLAAGALMGLGLALRRRARPVAVSESEREVRP
jgi:hypothetical protein